MESPTDQTNLNFMRPAAALILVLVVSVPIMFWNLGGRDLWAPDEPRFAQIAREMVRSGDWIVPRMNGQEVALLPPMTYWLVAIPSAIAGDVTEFTARLLIAVMGLVGVFATFFLGKRMFGCRVGLFSALILATSFKYLWQARWLQADMPLAAFVTMALLFFYCGFTAERRKGLYYHLFCVCMGLAFLAKGPLGVVLPGLVIIPFLTWTWSWRRITEMRIPTGILTVLVIVAPWYMAVGLLAGKDFLREIIIKHNFGMFFETWSHKEPFHFYIPHAFWLMTPWALFLFPALFHPASEEEKNHRRFLLCWVVIQFLFFTASQAKQEKYLLPIFPAAAILIGRCWTDYIAGRLGRRLRTAMKTITGLMALLFIVAGPALAIGARVRLSFLFGHSLVLAALLLAGGIVILAFLWRNRLGWCFVLLVGSCLATHLFCAGWMMPRFNALKSAREFCNRARRVAGENDPIGIYGINYRQIGAYCFYLDRPIRIFEDENEDFVQAKMEEMFKAPTRAFCIVKDDYLPSLQGSPNITVAVLFADEVGHRRVYFTSNQKESNEGALKK
ncbi:MAG: glycosyltransferase family 39 protein [Planctomycetota bacterium]